MIALKHRQEPAHGSKPQLTGVGTFMFWHWLIACGLLLKWRLKAEWGNEWWVCSVRCIHIFDKITPFVIFGPSCRNFASIKSDTFALGKAPLLSVWCMRCFCLKAWFKFQIRFCKKSKVASLTKLKTSWKQTIVNGAIVLQNCKNVLRLKCMIVINR